MRFILIMSMLAALPATAHVFDDLPIAGATYSTNYVHLNLSDTVKGRRILCAVYDEAGELLASDTQITDNLATEVLIRLDRPKMATQARCVFND